MHLYMGHSSQLYGNTIKLGITFGQFFITVLKLLSSSVEHGKELLVILRVQELFGVFSKRKRKWLKKTRIPIFPWHRSGYQSNRSPIGIYRYASHELIYCSTHTLQQWPLGLAIQHCLLCRTAHRVTQGNDGYMYTTCINGTEYVCWVFLELWPLGIYIYIS